MPQTGADMLETLAAHSEAPALVRASVYGQAVQAWMMSNHPDRAFDAATMALALSPNDADLLIDRAVADGSMERYPMQSTISIMRWPIDPRRVEAFVLRASAWRHLNNRRSPPATSIMRWQSIPTMPRRCWSVASCASATGDPAGAREDWQRAINLDPDSTTADLAQQDLALLEAGPKQ